MAQSSKGLVWSQRDPGAAVHHSGSICPPTLSPKPKKNGVFISRGLVAGI